MAFLLLYLIKIYFNVIQNPITKSSKQLKICKNKDLRLKLTYIEPKIILVAANY